MENSDKPIYPCMMQQVGDNSFRAAKPNDPKEWNMPMEGLTKREYFAAMAMQGILANESFIDRQATEKGNETLNQRIGQVSVMMADELLKALEK